MAAYRVLQASKRWRPSSVHRKADWRFIRSHDVKSNESKLEPFFATQC